MTTSLVLSKNDLASVRLDQDKLLKRRMPRPPELRQKGYEDEFDFHTVFFDTFRLPSGGTRFLGPRPLNLKKIINQSTLTLDGRTKKLTDWEGLSYGRVNRTYRMDIEQNFDRFEISLPVGQTLSGTVQENRSELFRGRRVLMTMIKYDPLEWVAQWAEFHVNAQGIDALLIYNNEALNYTSEDIEHALKAVPGLEVIVVIDWSFPYGPGAGGSGLWDSAFAQTGAMEHARYRFLSEAACVVNADVDELVFSHHATETVASLVAKSRSGYLRYYCRDASGPNGLDRRKPQAERRFSDSYYVDVTGRERLGKWVVVPSLCPAKFEWGTHQIGQMESDLGKARFLCYRHFGEFNTGWKSERSNPEGVFQKDETMYQTYRRVGWFDSAT